MPSLGRVPEGDVSVAPRLSWAADAGTGKATYEF